jgi:hypothetical protein
MARLAQRERDPDYTRACAVHEAGHAVVALALGVGVERVALGVGCAPENDGETETHGGDLRARIAVDLAGALAVGTLCGGHVPRQLRLAACEDYRMARQDARRIDPHAWPYYYRDAERRAARILRRHWPAVLALGRALLQTGRLTGDEARAIFARHS